MKKRVLFVILVSTALLLGGCGVYYQKHSRTTSDRFMQLNAGMSHEEVISILGTPYKRELYDEKEFLIYETDHRARTEKERFTPILIKSGKVIGWGRNYYDDTIKSKIDADIKINKE